MNRTEQSENMSLRGGFGRRNPKSRLDVIGLPRRFTPRNDQKAFTLAEILITLGIIGVVAAYTIPTLINKTQDSELKTQFKKAYSSIYGAVFAVKADLGYMPECYTDYSGTNHSSECSIFQPEFKKQLNVAKTCNTASYENGCISYFTGAQELGLITNVYYTTSFLQNSAPSILLANGMWILSVSSWADADNYVVDINGKKKPNKWGYDIFKIVIISDGDNIKITGTPFYESGGKTFDEMLQWAFR